MPWRGQQESPSKTRLPEYDAQCYLCPGNTRALGDKNPHYQKPFIFLNDYSAVKEDQADYVQELKDGGTFGRLNFEESIHSVSKQMSRRYSSEPRPPRADAML